MGAYFVFYPRARIKTLVIYRVFDIPAYVVIGVWILFQLIYGGLAGLYGNASGIGWCGHIGGFFFGVAFALTYKAVTQRRRLRPE
jgi:membrane associated rhomboid family serine protease